MKYPVFFFSAVLLLFHTGFCLNLEISGTYTQSEDWDVDTLNVTGDVLLFLPDSETITIIPGTVVLFQGPYIIITGNSSLIMEGTEEQPILFTTIDTSVHGGGILFDPSFYAMNGIDYTAAPIAPEDTLKFTYIIFKRCTGRYGIINFSAYNGKGLRPLLISGCHFLNNGCSGIYAMQREGSTDSFPIITTNCVFENNSNVAINISNYNLVVQGNSFYKNQQGGIELHHSSAQIIDNIFENNRRNVDGSAIFAMADPDDTVFLSGNVFIGNSVGPAVSLEQLNVSITDNRFINNHCENGKLGGGGLFLNNTYDAFISRNTFLGNSVAASSDLTFGGGALNVNFNFNKCIISNNGFIDNSASTGGAIHCNSTDSVYFINNTVCTNRADRAPAMYIMSPRGIHYLGNSLFYKNQNTADSTISAFDSNRWEKYVNVINCILEYIDSTDTVFQFEQCFTGVPDFNDTAENDYSLKEGSIGIDAGSNDFAGLYLTEEIDLAGNPRIYNEIIDIGAYEFQEPEPVRRLTIHTSERLQKNRYRISFFGTSGAGGRAFTLNGSVLKQTSRKSGTFTNAALIEQRSPIKR